MYIDRPLKEYLDDLGARKAAPGGGSAAALAASIGTALMSMVAGYSAGGSAEKGADKKMQSLMDKVRGYDKELRLLIDEDVAAYEKLRKSLKEMKPGRDAAAADELYKDAIEPPFIVCELARKCMDLCVELAEHGNPKLVTDTAIAAIMLESAFQSARFNVYINLGCVKDVDYIAKVHNVIRGLEEKMPKLREDILERCEDVIRENSGKQQA